MAGCPQCGTPTAPSWVFCPKCAAPLDSQTDPTPSDPSTEPVRTQQTPSNPRRKLWASSRLRRIGAMAVVLVVVLFLVALASERSQLSDSQAMLTYVSSRLRQSQTDSASTQSSMLNTQSALENALQSEIALRQGVTGSPGTILVELPQVQGVGGILILSPPSGAHPEVSLTTVITGAVLGRTYDIVGGRCPEESATEVLGASSIAVASSVVLPTTRIELPDNGTRFYFRLQRRVSPADSASGVLGGVFGPFLQGPNGGQGTPVPPNRPAC
jgi:hypothetical protein